MMNEVGARLPRAANLSCFGVTRRDQLKMILAAFLPFALAGEAHSIVPARRMPARSWVERQEEIARALSLGQMTPLSWMTEVERLAFEIDLDELLALVSRSRVTPAGDANHNDPKKRYIRFLDEQGEPRRLTYGAAFFDFSPANVVTPHGHKHMVSAHMVVNGRFRVRNFDRLRDEGEAMVIRPTRDYVAHRGMISAMSSQRDNIHWFVPVDGPATTFDVVISGIDPGAPEYEIRAIDPLGGRRMGDGTILAPIMSFADSSARYTSDV